MDLKKNFRREVLPNGVTLLFEKREFPVCSVSITSRMGAVYETKEERGLTHFMEHLLLKGTKKITGEEIDKRVEESGGEFNAFTSNEDLKLWLKAPDNFLDEGIDLLIDISQNSLFKEKDIQKERKVIFEEIDMILNNPEDYALDKLEKTLYSEPFSMPILGTKENLKKIKRKDLIKKYKEVFSPENLIVTVVGNYSYEKLKRKIVNSYKKSSSKKLKFPEIKKNLMNIVEYKKEMDQARFIFTFHSPLSSEKETYVMDVLYSILIFGTSSRLYSRLRHKEAIIYESRGVYVSKRDFAYTYFEFGCSKENVPLVKKAILEEFRNLIINLNKRELEFAKNKLIGDYKLGMESCEQEERSLSDWEISGNAEEFYKYPKRIQNVKLEDVKKLAKEVADGNYGTFTLTSKK